MIPKFVAAPAGSGSEATETGWVTPDPSTGTRPRASDGVFVSIEVSEPCAVVCAAKVAAPVGSGNEETDTGCVGGKLLTLTFPPACNGEPNVLLISVSVLPDAPVIPKSVAAPSGNGSDTAETGWVAPDPSTGTRPLASAGVLVSIEETAAMIVSCPASVAAPIGNGRDTADIGWIS